MLIYVYVCTQAGTHTHTRVYSRMSVWSVWKKDVDTYIDTQVR